MDKRIFLDVCVTLYHMTRFVYFFVGFFILDGQNKFLEKHLYTYLTKASYGEDMEMFSRHWSRVS